MEQAVILMAIWFIITVFALVGCAMVGWFRKSNVAKQQHLRKERFENYLQELRQKRRGVQYSFTK